MLKRPLGQYLVMDGRANYSIDDAIVYCVDDSWEQAAKSVMDYDNAACIVYMDKTLGGGPMRLLWSLMWGDPPKHENGINKALKKL